MAQNGPPVLGGTDIDLNHPIAKAQRFIHRGEAVFRTTIANIATAMRDQSSLLLGEHRQRT
jgi:hypothetical protein